MTVEIRPLPPEVTEVLFRLGGRKLVLVEGETDAEVLDIWFEEHLADVLFYPSGGYLAVSSKVAAILEVRPDVDSLGIRDRDFCSDEAVSKSQTDPDERVLILNRYAVENYLLDPDAVCHEMKVFLGKKSPVKTAGEVETMLVGFCDDLAVVMAANWLLTECSAEALSVGFDINDRDAIIHRVADARKVPADTAGQEVADRITELHRLSTTLEDAHKYTNGKHLTHQLYMSIAAIHRGLLKEHLRRLLAHRVKEIGSIPVELLHIFENRILKTA